MGTLTFGIVKNLHLYNNIYLMLLTQLWRDPSNLPHCGNAGGSPGVVGMNPFDELEG